MEPDRVRLVRDDLDQEPVPSVTPAVSTIGSGRVSWLLARRRASAWTASLGM